MAKLHFVLQAATSRTSADAIDKILSLKNLDRALFCVAYVRESGVRRHEAALRMVAGRTRVLIGIRNEITSVQAVERLLATGVEVFAVDTAKRERVFHPKIYLSRNGEESLLLIGSANLTRGGMARNIEASTLIALSLKEPADLAYFDEVLRTFETFRTDHPKHVFRVMDAAHARRLLEQGRLSDERVVQFPPVAGSLGAGKQRDDLPPMKLFRGATDDAPIAPLRGGPADTSEGYVCVWKSRPLKKSNLNIPTGGKQTNPTGFIGLGKGLLTDINQLTYFRSRVFKGLQWARDDPKKPHLELAQAEVRVVIKQVDYGTFTLSVRHNSNKKTATAAQDNHVTALRWGPMRDLVGKRDLLGRTLTLYRRDGLRPTFLIDID